MNARVKEIKLRNLNRILEDLEDGIMPCRAWCNEDRDWRDGEREAVINDLRVDIAEIEAKG